MLGLVRVAVTSASAMRLTYMDGVNK